MWEARGGPVGGTATSFAQCGSRDLTLVTVDRNLVYQQNVASAGIAVIVLHAHGNRVRDLLPLLPELRESAARIRSGEIVHLGG
jgi:hypothetical protein